MIRVPLTLSFMNIHAKLHPLLYKSAAMFVHRTKKLRVRSTGVGSYLIIIPYANREDPGSALIAKVLKGISMR